MTRGDTNRDSFILGLLEEGFHDHEAQAISQAKKLYESCLNTSKFSATVAVQIALVNCSLNRSLQYKIRIAADRILILLNAKKIEICL